MSQQALTFAGSPLSGAAMIAALESKLQSLASSRSGTSRPSDIVAGEEWLDTTTATAWLVKRWDGVDDITTMTINTTANTVTFTGTATSGANSNITSLTGLTTPLSVAQGGTASATAADARTALGLAIGTDVPAYDADICISDVAKGYSAQHTPTAVTVTSTSNSVAFNNATCAYATLALGENSTLADPSNKVDGQAGELVVTPSGTRTLAVHANWKMANGTTVSLAPVDGKKTWIYWECNGTYNYITDIIQES